MIFFRPQSPATTAGATVMAFGIFGLAALPRLPGVGARGVQVFALLEAAGWALLAAGYAASMARGERTRHVGDAFTRFGIGTWVAGTGVTGELLFMAWPQLRAVALALLALACGLWLWLLVLALGGVPALLRRPHRGGGSTGVLLLATVATQAVVVLAASLGVLPAPVGVAVIALGGVLYAGASAFLVWRYLAASDRSLARQGSNTHCIVHGAVSISGLALASVAAAAPWVVHVWLLAAGLFVAVEALEVARWVDRVRRLGWREGVLTYGVSQWVRNFTFGMFYAFTVALAARPDARPLIDGLGVTSLVAIVVDWGQFVVLAVLVIETGLWWASFVQRGKVSRRVSALRRRARHRRAVRRK